jgi:hypothetical protein
MVQQQAARTWQRGGGGKTLSFERLFWRNVQANGTFFLVLRALNELIKFKKVLNG